MLMTAVMRKHPHFGLTQLLLAFFDQFAQYDWSIPVTLVPTERHPEMECDQMVWEGNHSRETPVVILTPCFPASNASRNVTFSARQLIATELNRGLLVLQSALRGETEIEEIFTRVDFASEFLVLHRGDDGIGFGDAAGGVDGLVREQVGVGGVSSADCAC